MQTQYNLDVHRPSRMILIAGILAICVGLIGFCVLGLWASETSVLSAPGISRNYGMPPVAEVADAGAQGAVMATGAATPTEHAMSISNAALFSMAEAQGYAHSTCSGDSGWIEYATYPSSLLGEPVPFRVYLPPCYDRSQDQYPVVYLLHGDMMDESHWDELGADEVVEAGVDQGLWAPFILVMPRLPEPLFTHTDGGDVSYEMEMLSGLIPYVESHYRVRASADYRFLAGISRGGVWALEIGFHHPELFEGVIALSPALNVNHARSMYDPFELAATQTDLPESIFLAVGEQDAARIRVEDLHNVLDQRGVVHTFALSSGNRSVESWRHILGDIFHFAASTWN